MGRELECRARIGDRWAKGKALLETTEVIFRGEARLKVPLASLTSVEARNGELHLKWQDGSAALELGAQAEKWAHSILNPKSIADKLGIKAGMTISAIHMPSDEVLRDAEKAGEKFSSTNALPESNIIFLRVSKASELDGIKKLLPSLASDGAIWVVYPKGQKDVTELMVLQGGRAVGLVDVKVVSYSATHTALKFVRPKNRR